MSCNTCSRKFNIFTPERGCPSCGFSYCGKCINQMMFVKKHNKNEKVCTKCKLGQTELKNESAETIRNTKTININSSQCTNTNAIPSTSDNINEGFTEKDKELADRLQRLKNDTSKSQNPPTDEDINSRLSRLKGVEPKLAIKAFPICADLRSDEEKTADLLGQFLEECDIDKQQHDPDSHLRARLDKLRGTSSISKGGEVDVSDDEDEESLAEKLVKKYSAEAKLEDDFEEVSNESEDKTDELPWCFLCNEDAALRCTDCSGDLFCRSCFKQSHKEWNYPNHNAVPYIQKKTH